MKDWQDTDDISPMNHPPLSRTAIDRAGERLIHSPTDEAALKIVEEWRSIHRTAMVLRKQSPSSEYHERLKRTVSIIGKLRRNPTMKLSRIQDIWGIRLVLPETVPIENIRDVSYDGTELSSCKLVKTHDYIEQPKDSGYRAIHKVYVFSDLPGIDLPIQVELQIRTHRQHLWAMAVETVEMVYGEPLKSSQGDQGWLDFFNLASAAIAISERSPVSRWCTGLTAMEVCERLCRMGTEDSYFTKLAAIHQAQTEFPTEDYPYWLLELNVRERQSSVYGFQENQVETAQAMYSALEKLPACQRGDTHIVLVSTRGVAALKSAYPSYFLDIREFSELLHRSIL